LEALLWQSTQICAINLSGKIENYGFKGSKIAQPQKSRKSPQKKSHHRITPENHPYCRVKDHFMDLSE
jgi:hypothetical protein